MIFGSEKGGQSECWAEHCPPPDGDSNVAHLPKTLEMWVSSARHECFGDEPAKSAQEEFVEIPVVFTCHKKS